MPMRAGIAADTAAALLFRILSQPALLFPLIRQVEGVEVQHEPSGGYILCYRKQIEVPAAEATIEATAQGIVSMLCAYGPEVEWRTCTIWEAAYGLIPFSSSAVDLPEIIVSTPLQPPVLSWNLYIPLLKVLEYLPRGSPSEAYLMKIFVATFEAILQRTFPPEPSREQTRKTRYNIGSASKNLAVAELRTMAQSEKLKNIKSRKAKKQGLVAAFDSYVLAVVCALACELQLFPLVTRGNNQSTSIDVQATVNPVNVNGSCIDYGHGIDSAIHHTNRILAILEALFSLKPSSVGTSWGYSSNEIVAAAMVAAHVSELFRRSKACMYALYVLMRCKWDNEIYSKASSLYNLIDIHNKAVASIVNMAEPLEAQLIYAPVGKSSHCLDDRKQNKCLRATCFDPGQSSTSEFEDSTHSNNNLRCERLLASNEGSGNSLGKGITSFPIDASDLANFLTRDRHIGFNCSAQFLLRLVLVEKQELCFSVVSLLWHKMIAAPETQLSAESTSAQ
ncbi:Protein GIGANTEA [Hibiscus syriacus]|uniref:Protein GIGANTEA n=1 Tax=Hibiscus syriacus TaxID=106335 RepID=A0A6A3CUE7_HIBSY|nr:Protein GIGANTEA [Hibiscus syriacus]KAE8730819.1 Protein GIGANTEA [Hibiscus syriacus]